MEPICGSTETLEFTPPEECHAVVVRLRRLPSRRFDSKIAGTLWLDDFKLEKLNAEGSRLKAQGDPQNKNHPQISQISTD